MGLSDELLNQVVSEFSGGIYGSDVPVTALVFDRNDTLIGRGRNRREVRSDPTSHAEIEAIRDAAFTVSNWRLDGMTLISSLEPCLMCASVIREARVARVFFAMRANGPGSDLFDLLRDTRVAGDPVEVGRLPSHILETETDRLRDFFRELRQG